MRQSKKISVLIPTEFHERSEGVRRAALSLCRRLNATAVLLHVAVETYRDPAWHTTLAPLMPVEVHYESILRRQFEKVERYFEDNGVRCVSVVRQGDVAGWILKEAESMPADYIVMGSKHRTVASGILGGTVEHVLARAHCPVIVIPHETAPAEAVLAAGRGLV